MIPLMESMVVLNMEDVTAGFNSTHDHHPGLAKLVFDEITAGKLEFNFVHHNEAALRTAIRRFLLASLLRRFFVREGRLPIIPLPNMSIRLALASGIFTPVFSLSTATPGRTLFTY